MREKLRFLSVMFGALFVIAVALSCSNGTDSDNNDDNGESKKIVPLAVGNFWVYSNTGFDFVGAFEYTDTLQITGDTVVNGETWYKATYKSASDEGNNFLLTNRSDGLWQWQLYTGGSQELIAKFPAILTDAWAVAAGGSKTIVNLDTLVQSGPGFFRCIHYSYEYQAVASHEYYCPNVGLVYRSETEVDPFEATDTVFHAEVLLSEMHLQQ
ncbi:MAG: hypothetical protein ABIJ61_03350 [bacterium]